MNSSRYKGKALEVIAGKPNIQWVCDSVKRANVIDDLVVCTTIDESDDSLVSFLKSNNINFYRGSIENVALRLYEGAKKFNADTMIRVVGDHPLNSHELLEILVESHVKLNADYSIINRSQIPVGVLSEAFSMKAFQKLFQYNFDLSFSEYLSYYFSNNPELFLNNIVNVPLELQEKPYRLCIDYPEDKKVIESLIVKAIEKYGVVTYKNILDVIHEHTHIVESTLHIQQKYLQPDLLNKINTASTHDDPQKNRNNS